MVENSADYQLASPSIGVDKEVGEAGLGDAKTPCPVCKKCFSLSTEQRDLIAKALQFNDLVQGYFCLEWNELLGQHGGRDWVNGALLDHIRRQVKAASGLYQLELDALPIIRGAFYIALAAGVLNSQEHKQSNEIMILINRYVDHLKRHNNAGCDDDAGRDELTRPRYIGVDELEQIWFLAPELAGKSFGEMAGTLKAKLDGLLVEIKTDAAKRHYARGGQLQTLEHGIWVAVRLIELEADRWVQRMKQTCDCVEVDLITDEVHKAVFLIDELLATGCMSASPETVNGLSVTNAVEKISDLIDWDECPYLKEFCRKIKERESELPPVRESEIPF